jgi:fatty acid amide hydrolase
LCGQKSLTRIIPYFGGKGEEHLRTWAGIQADYRREFLAAMEQGGLDALISPVCALPAFPHNSVDKLGLGGVYTLLYNVLGFPAGVARIGQIQDHEAVSRHKGLDLVERAAAKTESLSAGLSLSVQIAAKPWREDIVLSLIEALHRRQI